MNLDDPSSPGGNQAPKKIEAYQCNLCPAVFGFKFNAKRHFQKLHPDDEYDGSKIANIKFKCYGCQWGFDTYGSLESHFAQTHQGQVLNPEKVYLGDTQTTAATFQSVKRMKTPSKRKRPTSSAANLDTSRPGSASSSSMPPQHMHPQQPPPRQPPQHQQRPPQTCQYCGIHVQNDAALASHVMMAHPERSNNSVSYQGDLLCNSCDFTCDNPQSLALHQQTHVQPHYNAAEMHQPPSQQQGAPHPYYPPHPPTPHGNGMPQHPPPPPPPPAPSSNRPINHDPFMDYKVEDENLGQAHHPYQPQQHQMYHQQPYHYPPPNQGYDQQGYHHPYHHHGYNEQMPQQYHQPYHHYSHMPPQQQQHHAPHAPPPPPQHHSQQPPQPPEPQQATPPQILSPPPAQSHNYQTPTPPLVPQYQEVPQPHFQQQQQQQPMIANSSPYHDEQKLSNVETEALRNHSSNGRETPQHHHQQQQFHDPMLNQPQNSPRQNGNDKAATKQRRTNIGKMFQTHICFVCDAKLAKLDCIKMHFKNKHSETPLDLNKVMISRVVCYVCGVRKKEYAILVRHFQVEHKDQDIDPYKIGMDDPTPFNLSPEEEADLTKLPIPDPVKHDALKRSSVKQSPAALLDDNTMDSVSEEYTPPTSMTNHLVKDEDLPPAAKKSRKPVVRACFKNHKCLTCGKTFSRNTTARKHFLDQHPDQEFDRSKIEVTQLPCYLCEFTFKDSITALRHFEASHPGVEFDPRQVQVTGIELTNGAADEDDLDDVNGDGFRCFLCNFWCSTIEDFQVHFAPETKAHENVSEVTIICPMCKHRCETTEEMFDHVTNEHSTDNSLSKDEHTTNNCVETC